MDLTGINMMVSIQKGKYIMGVNCANLVKDMDYQHLEICERSQEKKY